MEVEVWDKDLTLFKDWPVLDFEVMGCPEAGYREKIDSTKFRENTCADKKRNPKQTKPKVSAVSWTINKEFRVYMCSQRVKDRGIFKATQA